MTEALALRPRRVFVGWVLAVYALARVVTTTILLLVMQHQVPSGMTGGDDVPVSYFPFTALWDGQWYQTIAQHGYPSDAPHERGRRRPAERVGVLPALPASWPGPAWP